MHLLSPGALHRWLSRQLLYKRVQSKVDGDADGCLLEAKKSGMSEDLISIRPHDPVSALDTDSFGEQTSAKRVQLLQYLHFKPVQGEAFALHAHTLTIQSTLGGDRTQAVHRSHACSSHQSAARRIRHTHTHAFDRLALLQSVGPSVTVSDLRLAQMTALPTDLVCGACFCC